MSTNIKNKLGTLKFKLSKKPHIVVDTSICDTKCPHKRTLHVCPAGCYELVEGKMKFQYEDCVECGTCYHACDQGAVDWNYPESGFGVTFSEG